VTFRTDKFPVPGLSRPIMTPNTRKEARHRRRLRVVFEGRPAFTTNVNLSGFCAELMRAVSPSSTVEGIITVQGRDFEYVGDVRWVKPGDLRLRLPSRVGVQFVRVAPEFATAFTESLPKR